jgi:isopenicillin N synthase-like dioxygenase
MSVELKEKLPAAQASVIEAIRAGAALPLLDLGPFLAGEPGAVDQLAADVRAIQESLGFYAIINHGVDPALIDAAVEQSRLVFALPDEAKLKYQKQGHMQGYWPAKTVANFRPGFENEREKDATLGGWTFMRDRAPDDPKVTGNWRHRAMNKWPDPALVPDFRPTLNRYHQAMLDLGLKLVPVYARALGLPDDYFAKDFEDLEWYSRCNHYDGRPNPGGMLANTAHSDHSFLTLLPISPVPGLQVRTPTGDWIDVAYQPGVIIVNTGEWLNHLSNGRFLATPHRVAQPTSERITLPVFIDPNDEAMNTPIPGALKPGEARKFAPMKWHDFFVSYVDAYTKT